MGYVGYIAHVFHRSPGDTNGIPNDDAQLYATVITPGKRGLTIAPKLRGNADLFA